MFSRADIPRDDAKVRLSAGNGVVEMSERDIVAEMPGVEMEIGSDEGADIARCGGWLGESRNHLDGRREGAGTALQEESDAEAEDDSDHINKNVARGANAIHKKELDDFRADGKEEGDTDGEGEGAHLKNPGGGESLEVKLPEKEGENGKLHDVHEFASAHGEFECLPG